MSKRVRKRFNPIKRLEIQARQQLKHFAVVYYTGNTHCLLVDLRTHKPAVMTTQLYHLLSQVKHKWTVFMAAFNRDANDKVYIKPLEVESSYNVYQYELEDVLNQEHNRLLKNSNQQHLFGAGWIAVPHSKIWAEDKATKVFSDLGAFNFKQVGQSEEGILIEEMA